MNKQFINQKPNKVPIKARFSKLLGKNFGGMITKILIAINVLIFIMMEINGGSKNFDILLRFGAMQNYRLLELGEYWRLFTAMFLHIGFAHLLMNMYALYYMGDVFEHLYGSIKFLIMYILMGFFGNLLTFAINDPMLISAGASTAIYGLFGLSIAIKVIYKKIPQLKSFGSSFTSIIVINLIYSFINPTVSLVGHVGGLIGGIVVGMIFSISAVKRHHKKIIRIIGLVLFIILSIVLFNMAKIEI